MPPSCPSFLPSFHTTFNLTNTAILIWFIPQIEKIVCRVIKPRNNEEEEDFRLRFISSGIMQTPELSVLEAQKEITSFAERIQRMFGMVRDLLQEKDETKFVKLFSRIEKYENISDNMELEIRKIPRRGERCPSLRRDKSKNQSHVDVKSVR